MSAEREQVLRGGGRTSVVRRGKAVHRKAGSWAPSVHRLLKHLKIVGFCAAPRVIASGFDGQGRETLACIEGDFVHPAPWILRHHTKLERALA